MEVEVREVLLYAWSHMHIYTFTYIYIYNDACAHTYVRVQICTYTHTHTHIYIYIYIHMHAHVHIHPHTYSNLYIFMQVSTLFINHLFDSGGVRTTPTSTRIDCTLTDTAIEPDPEWKVGGGEW